MRRLALGWVWLCLSIGAGYFAAQAVLELERGYALAHITVGVTVLLVCLAAGVMGLGR